MSSQEWQHHRDESRRIWDHNAEFWDEWMGADGNVFAQKLVFPAADELLGLTPGAHVLEIACGNGTYARRLAAQGLRVTATDFSEVFIQKARARGGERIQYQVLDASDETQLKSLGIHQFDAAVCNMALMDMAELTPLLTTLPELIKPGGPFVFSLSHPCFNSSPIVRTLEEEDQEGEIVLRYGIKISRYLTPTAYKGLGIIGQPEPHLYFHRSLSGLLEACFEAGWVMDGIREPAFPPGENPGDPFSWQNYTEIPPVLVVRLRPRN